ncbi:MAG: ribonuclease Z [Bacteroidetes bacterium]|nr:ribonuclease Z [Bacteroidota bacterium]
MKTFAVTVLGSGAAIPLLQRNPSAHLLNIHENLYLVDCAEGTQLQLRKSRVRMQRIDHIFISHLHGDHYFGLLGLITSLHLLGRTKELYVFAHAKLKEIIDIHLDASNTVLRYPMLFQEINPEKHEMIFENDSVTVESFPLNHNFPVNGFLFREKPARPNIRADFLENRQLSNIELQKIKKGENYIDPEGNIYFNQDITTPPPPPRSYAYCSDTAYYEPVIPVIKGADLLYHEATFMEDKAQDAADKFHSTAAQAATIAKLAGVKRLMIGHYSARYKTLGALLNEAKAVFPETILADDGKVVIVNQEE